MIQRLVRRLSTHTAGYFLLGGLGLVLLYHVLLVSHLLPRTVMPLQPGTSGWLALAIPVLFSMPVMVRLGWFRQPVSKGILGCWLLTFYLVWQLAALLFFFSGWNLIIAIPTSLMAVSAYRLTFL